jgi:hypothetical protein
MLFRNTVLLAASAALAAAENVYLRVVSDHNEVNGNTVGFSHEGAGIDYAFLGTSPQSQVLDYDAEAHRLYNHEPGLPAPQNFEVDGEYVSVSVQETYSNIMFDNLNSLLVNGSADGFYACKDTNDPYNYSNDQYELMWYPPHIPAPSTCLDLTLVRDAVPSASPTFTVA